MSGEGKNEGNENRAKRAPKELPNMLVTWTVHENMHRKKAYWYKNGEL